MNAELLLNHFNRISEAPDAVPQLRLFILDLAVRGKLLEQHSREESAGQLLERIQAEKLKLVKDGKIKKEEPILQIDDEDLPFQVPTGWSWARLATISRRIHYGFTASANNLLKGVRLLRITDIQNNVVDWSSVPGCEISEREVDQYKLQQGDILIARTGGTIGKTFLVTQIPVVAVFASYLIRVQKTSEFYDRYLKLFLESPAYWKQLKDGARGAGQPNVNGKTLGRMIVSVPPLREQHRIVAKVDELMVLCDRLQAAQSEREKRRERLTAASYHYLNNGANADAFRSYADFYIRHLAIVTTRPKQIPDLRRAIVSLAVRGQLVAQDPTDEPASELLKHIEAAKAWLVKERKINPANVPVPASADQLGFELRPGWQAARISQLLVDLQTGPFGSSLHESDYVNGGIPVINPASIKNGRLVPIDSMAVGPATLKRLVSFKLRENDIVMARRGEMGRCGIVTEREAGWLCGTGSLILRLPSCLFPPFFVTLIGSPFVREYLGGSAVGATMQNLNQSILLSLVVGLPPLAEQQRIVARVNELMTLCDRLAVQLTSTQADTSRLLESVLQHALEGRDQIREEEKR